MIKSRCEDFNNEPATHRMFHTLNWQRSQHRENVRGNDWLTDCFDNDGAAHVTIMESGRTQQ